MLRYLQLTIYTKKRRGENLFNVPIECSLQEELESSWGHQVRDFIDDIEEVPFDAGYKPEPNERFVINDFTLPEILQEQREQLVTLDGINEHEDALANVKAFVVFAQDLRGNEMVIFQKFSKSHVIKPGRFLFLANGVNDTLK